MVLAKLGMGHDESGHFSVLLGRDTHNVETSCHESKSYNHTEAWVDTGESLQAYL